MYMISTFWPLKEHITCLGVSIALSIFTYSSKSQIRGKISIMFYYNDTIHASDAFNRQIWLECSSHLVQ